MLPLLAVGGKDAVAKKGPPELVPLRAMAETVKPGGKDRLDLFWLACDEDSLARQAELCKMLASWQGVQNLAAPVGKAAAELVFANVIVKFGCFATVSIWLYMRRWGVELQAWFQTRPWKWNLAQTDK